MLPFYCSQTAAHLVEYVEGVISCLIFISFAIYTNYIFCYVDVFMLVGLIVNDYDVPCIQFFHFQLHGYMTFHDYNIMSLGCFSLLIPCCSSCEWFPCSMHSFFSNPILVFYFYLLASKMGEAVRRHMHVTTTAYYLDGQLFLILGCLQGSHFVCFYCIGTFFVWLVFKLWMSEDLDMPMKCFNMILLAEPYRDSKWT